MSTRRMLALVLLVILLGIMGTRSQAAPIPFQPYGEKSSADVVLQWATINHSPWRAEFDDIVVQPSSETTSLELSDFEKLIVQYQDNEQALLLLVPLYWLVTEHSGHIEQRQHFLAQFTSASADFRRLISVGLLLQLHELSLLNVNSNTPFRQDIQFQYEQLLTQFQQQKQPSLLNLWASALLHFYMPGGGLVVADTWLQAQTESTETPEVITLYRKILHELAGQSFPLATTSCWPLSCADAMSTDEMASRIQRAYKVFSNDGFAQAWRYLKEGVHCLYNAQSNPVMFNFQLCMQYFDHLNSVLRMLEDSLAVNDFAAGWREYQLLKESYAETFNFQNRVSNQVQYAYQNEERRINQIEDPETRLEAPQDLLDSPLAGFASAASVQQQRQNNARQLQAIREVNAKHTAIEQAFTRFQMAYKSLLQQINHRPEDESLREQLLSLTESEDARTGLAETGRSELRENARSDLASVRENNRLNRLYHQFEERKAAILQRFEQSPEAALEDLIGLVNSELGESLTMDSRSAIREKYQAQLTTLRAEQRARAQEQARIQNSFERISKQAKSLLDQIIQSPDNEALLNEYIALLDSPDASTSLSDNYRQKARGYASKLLDNVRKKHRNQRLVKEYQDEYSSIMATYEATPILATEKALTLLNSEKAESLTPESRKEQREYHQNQLNQLKEQEQAQKERAEIEKSYQTRIQTLNHQREQNSDERAWLTGFIALLDSDTGRYFGETERAEKKQKAQELLAEFEPLPEPPGNEESLLFSALEAIGRGEDPLSQGIEQTTENLVRISYEHFPQGTEQVLAALSHIDSAIDTVVEFVDDRTGNTVSAMWAQLDETSQARILGAGKVLSVLVPVAKVKAQAEFTRTPSPALKKDGWHPESVDARRKGWQEHYGDQGIYENPGHHDPRGERNQYNSKKSVLPENHKQLWKESILTKDGNRWTKVGVGKKAVYHRFQDDGNGNWHWNGSTDGKTANGELREISINNVPTEVKRW